MLGLKRGTVQLKKHDPAWAEIAAETIKLLRSTLDTAAVDIQHVGSTAIRGIYAKPILDIAVLATAFAAVEARIPALERAGIIYRGYDRPGEMLFVLGDFSADTRTHHIHVVEQGDPAWADYLNFRDYLNAHPQKAAEYEKRKLELAQKYPNDRAAYTAAKHPLITRLLIEAAAQRRKPI